jgi:DNA-binding IclR family transcriptional regulator
MKAPVSEQPADTGRDGAVVRSVDRALSIMEMLARDGWSGVTEMARDLDVHKSTVSRLVATLERRGMVEQHPSTQRYRLGAAMLRLADGVRGDLAVAEVARPTCERLSTELDETVNLAVLELGEVVNIEQASLSTAIIAVDWVGHRSPLHVTASGKLFLALGDPAAVEALLGQPLARITAHSVTDADELRAELEQVRLLGYAVTVGELEEGLNAVAAPVRAADGSILAAIVASGPEYRVTPERIPELGAAIQDAADSVSRRLGWVG